MTKMFGGKQTVKEEKSEANALKSGKISKAQYIKGEKSEGKKDSMKSIKANADAIKSGKMSPKAYANKEKC